MPSALNTLFKGVGETELPSLSCAFHTEYICCLRGNRELTIKRAMTIKAYLLTRGSNEGKFKHSDSLEMTVDTV